jgi:cycloeucalenol cycloisomerase
LYSPVWMALMALMMFTGWASSFGNLAMLVHSLLVALPLVIVPAILRRGKNPSEDWKSSYWFKANLYMFVFGVFGNYFGSEYFFDVLGMVYRYPNVTTNLDAALLGSGEQTVPLIMYFYTHAYFMTYHTSAVLVLRRINSSGLPFKRFVFPIMIFVIGYSWAWIETKAMANPLMADMFYYEKQDIMLAYGSIVYSTYFIASFPIYYFLEEKRESPWNLLVVIAAGLSASMLTFYLLDLCAHMIGRL